MLVAPHFRTHLLHDCHSTLLINCTINFHTTYQLHALHSTVLIDYTLVTPYNSSTTRPSIYSTHQPHDLHSTLLINYTLCDQTFSLAIRSSHPKTHQLRDRHSTVLLIYTLVTSHYLPTTHTNLQHSPTIRSSLHFANQLHIIAWRHNSYSRLLKWSGPGEV